MDDTTKRGKYNECRDGTLCDESVEVLIRGLGNIQVSLADVIDGFIVDHKLE
jgi:hypothetical protein